MLRNRLVRPSIVAAVLGAALSASAQVKYSFGGTDTFFGFVDSFELIVPDFVSTNTTFQASALASSSSSFFGTPPDPSATTAIQSVRFRPNFDTNGFEGIVDYVDVTHLVTDSFSSFTVTNSYYFTPPASGTSSFAAFGSYNNGNNRSPSAVLGVSPVPEPATMGVVGLGAVAVLRRRKRA